MMRSHAEKFEAEVSAWLHISVHPHRFGGREFRFEKAEVGHVHTWGTVDIPCTRPIRDALLEEGLAEEDRWVPDSGWTTFHIRSGTDLEHALWLMRLSYLRYTLQAASDSQRLLLQATEDLHLTPRFTSLLAQFLPARSNRVSAELV